MRTISGTFSLPGTYQPHGAHTSGSINRNEDYFWNFQPPGHIPADRKLMRVYNSRDRIPPGTSFAMDFDSGFLESGTSFAMDFVSGFSAMMDFGSGFLESGTSFAMDFGSGFSARILPVQYSSGLLLLISGIHGQLLEVTVVGCTRLKDTEWISRQDPYVCLEYASTKVRTPTCTDGGKNPTFQQKFVFTLIEGLREMNVYVWNSNTITTDDFIGSGKIQLLKVLSQGYDDSSWPLQTKTGRNAGEVRVIMHHANANKAATSYAPSAPPYMAPAMPQSSLYSTPPMAAGAYPPPASVPYPSQPSYPAHPTYSSYPPNPAAYPPPPPPYHSQPPPAYTAPYGAPSAYPPPPYPPSPYDPSHYHKGLYPGIYPPPPY